jgi:hypothetical protein
VRAIFRPLYAVRQAYGKYGAERRRMQGDDGSHILLDYMRSMLFLSVR